MKKQFVNPHVLTPLTSQIRSKKFLIFDIESKDGPTDSAGFTRPFMAGIFDGDYQAFWNEGEMEEWGDYWRKDNCIDGAMRAILTREYRGYNIYAHNGGRFDFLFLLPWLMNVGRDLGFQFTVLPVSSSIQVLDVWREKKGDNDATQRSEWRFIDSYKLIPLGLNKAAESLRIGERVEAALAMPEEDREPWLQLLTRGLTPELLKADPEKLTSILGKKATHNLNLPEADRGAWNSYNRQDCWLTYAVVATFYSYIESILQGEVGVTLPATAMKLFRRRFLHDEIARTIPSHDFIRASYCGGRCEDYIKEGKKLRIYDINSSYPAAMLELMPVGPGIHWEGQILPSFTHGNTPFVGFVKCDVHVPPMNIPPLPIKSEGDIPGVPRKLLFPTGNLTGTWEWSELQYALSLGCTIEHLHESWWYQAGYIFKDFVETLYSYRDKDDPHYDEGLSAVAKANLVSLYGKFAMRSVQTKIYIQGDKKCPDGATPARPNDPDCEVFYADEETDAEYIIPQISARVTAIGRVRLARFMHLAESLGGRVYYTDTDSITTDVEMPTSNKLGDLKLEYPGYAGHINGTFLGPKLYVLETDIPWQPPMNFFEVVKAKGFEKRTREVIDRIVKGDSVVNAKLEKIGSLARKSFRSGPLMMNVPRSLIPGQLRKRIQHDDGTTTPYDLKMWG